MAKFRQNWTETDTRQEQELLNKIREAAAKENGGGEATDTGFGTAFTSADIRLMNQDGSLNVKFKGAEKYKQFNLYKYLIRISSLNFYFILSMIYVILNALFATFYYYIGSEGLSVGTGEISWWDAFFFSTQTFTTVGYGHISPSSMMANIISSAEAFTGLLYFAIATGLVYGRFSTSKADVRFSDNILITEIDDEVKLTLRMANVSSTELSDLDAQIIMSWIEESEFGRPVRRYRNLNLELKHINLLTTSWTIVHNITNESPCKILNNTATYAGLEFMVFITAFDEIFDQKVKVRTSYIEKDILRDVKFIPITSYGEKSTVVDLDKLSKYVPINAIHH